MNDRWPPPVCQATKPHAAMMHRAQQLLGAVAAAVADQRARAQRAGDEVGEDPDLDRRPRRQPPERQQEDRPRERRLRVLVQHQPAAMVGVPRRELVKVGQRDARRLPGLAEVAPVAGRAEMIERPLASRAADVARRTVEDRGRGQAQRDGDARQRDQPGPPTADLHRRQISRIGPMFQNQRVNRRVGLGGVDLASYARVSRCSRGRAGS